MRIKHTLTLIILAGFFSLAAAAEEMPLQSIRIKPGDTLWSVANTYLKDPRRWPEILKFNNISSSDPNVILPGMMIKVPILLIKEHLRSAELVSILNRVDYRRKKEGTFTKAKLNMKLYGDDAVRTLANSQAQVKFYSGELLKIDQNSFIIIKPEKNQDEVSLLAGAVRASRARILAADTIVMPKITPKLKFSDFKTHIKKDKTTLVEVYAGLVDVTAQGETVTLSKGFGTEVKYLLPPSPPKKLPPLPELLQETLPGTDITARTRLTSGKLIVNLKVPDIGTRSKGRARVIGQLINKYHMQVASDTDFKTIVLDETNPLTEQLTVDFAKKDIPDGTYYYRIAYTDELGFEGQFTQPRRFIIDRFPPKLEILEPEEGSFVRSEFITVRGTTEPGCTVEINGRNVSVDNAGEFLLTFSSKKREVVLNIRSVDKHRNASTLTRSIIYLPGEAEDAKPFYQKPVDIFMGILTISVIAGVISLIF